MPRHSKKHNPGPGESSGSRKGISVFAELLPRDRHPHLIFKPQNYHYHEYNEALYKIHKKECEYPRVIDWHPLDVIGLGETIRNKLTQHIRYNGVVYDVTDLERLIAIQEPIYEELVMEFLATLEMYIVDSIDDKFLIFKLGGAPRHLSLRSLAVCLDIFTEEETEAPWFEQYIMTGARLEEGECSAEDWAEFSDSPYLSGKNLAKSLKSPTYNVIQKMLAHTFTLRGHNKEKVTKIDLWFLMKLEARERINLPYAVGKFLHAYASGTKPQSKLCGGHLITRIAKSFNVDLAPRNRPYTLVANPELTVGVEMYRSAGVLRSQGGDTFPSLSRVGKPLLYLEPGPGENGPLPDMLQKLRMRMMMKKKRKLRMLQVRITKG